MEKPKLGYWNMRGFAQPIRNLLIYLNVPFEDVRYGFGVESDANFPNQNEWLKVKYDFKFDFPNLPYLIDGDVKLTQSQTIIKYLAQKYNLRSSDPVTLANEDMLECQIIDIRNRFFRLVYRKQFLTQSEIDQLKQDYSVYLFQLEQWIGSKHWLTGEHISYVDFLAYEFLDWYREFVQTNCFDKFPQMTQYMKRFEQLDSLKSYLASDEYRKADCLSPYAILGYRGKNTDETGNNLYWNAN